MKDEKPVVYFVGEAKFHQRSYMNEEGHDVDYEFATVRALNHPRLGGGYTYTSVIRRKFEDGSFETLNTIYKPASHEIQNSEGN